MNIRRAARSDVEAVGEIFNDIIRNTAISFKRVELTADEIGSMIDEKPFFVADEDNSVIGFAYYGQFRGGTGYARTMEHTVMLSESARGKGVGRGLVGVVEDHARKSGVGSLWAGVSEANQTGVPFHAALGFERIAVLPKVGYKFDRWWDLTLMRKWLNPDI